MALLESSACGLLGGILGVAVAAVGIFSFAALIESSLGLPYLTPALSTVILLAAGTILLSIVVSAAASAISAWRLSRVNPGTALREGN
jgi:ABC-type antimicrobial peptide transport system permease subunit